jgi:hypothetical protein
LDIEIEGKKTSLINIYGSNNDSGICEIIENVVNRSNVITGDFNLVQNHFWLVGSMVLSATVNNICPSNNHAITATTVPGTESNDR